MQLIGVMHTGLLMNLLLGYLFSHHLMDFFITSQSAINCIWIAYPVIFIAMLGLHTAYYRLVYTTPRELALT